MFEPKFKAATNAYRRMLDTFQKRPRPIVLWVGAGLSAPAQLPTWPKLRDDLINELEKIASLEPSGGAKSGKLSEIKKQTDYWRSFGMLEDALGAETFRSEIRAAFNAALKAKVPSHYGRLWKLGIAGMITLNIDRFAQRSFTEAFPGSQFHEQHGANASALVGKITVDPPFITNLHGYFEDPATWVFTEKEKAKLFANGGYREFIRDCAKYCTIIFLGISADDEAVAEHFRKLAADGISTESHYWITDRRDSAAEAVESIGICVIQYSNTDRKHADLADIISDLENFRSNPAPTPAIPTLPSSGTLPGTVAEVMLYPPNKIREALNSYAAKILATRTDAAYAAFEDFCRKFARPILNAGYVSVDPSEEADLILDYRISAASEHREGAFGKVWRGIDSLGEPVAIKIFRHEVKDKPALLRAFRRGTQSLKILTEHSSKGVVRFRAATEIPPVIVMDWIEGANLQEAVHHGGLIEWHNKLRVMRDLALVIFHAHSVPERVLHRDIRPPNIMLRDYYSDPDAAEIVVLDFDLSWHVGAMEQSVVGNLGSAYLAPEQLASIPGMSSRSAAVDSFGFGMTMYFVVTGIEPTPMVHARPEWHSLVGGIIHKTCRSWKSIPNRVARLVAACTLEDQHKRPAFSQVVQEIEALYSACTAPESVENVALFAEEIMARTPACKDYVQSTDGQGFCRISPTGLQIDSRRDNGRLLLRFTHLQMGTERFQNLAAISDYIKTIPDLFLTAGFSAEKKVRVTHGNAQCDVFLHIEDTASFDQAQRIFSDVTNKLISLVGRL